MQFFEEQAKARSKTKYLVAFFLFNATLLSILNTVIIKLFFVNQILLEKFHSYRGRQISDFWKAIQNNAPAAELFRTFAFAIETKIFFANLVFFALLVLYYLNKYRSGAGVATSLGGVRIDNYRKENADKLSDKEKVLLNIVEEMSIASGVLIPEVYVLKYDRTINAFAAGGDRRNSIIAVTQGCLNLLDRAELQAVVAHEFSHILNEDVELNTKLSSVIMGFYLIFRSGGLILEGGRYKNRDPNKRKGSGGGSGAGGFAAFGILIMLTGSLGYLIGRWLQSRISREREFLADASSAQFTRYPDALASALAKIAMGAGSELIAPSKMEHSHIFFSSPFESLQWGNFDTHPPLRDRIQKLIPKQDITDTLDRAVTKLKLLRGDSPAKSEQAEEVKVKRPAIPFDPATVMAAKSLDMTHETLDHLSDLHDHFHDEGFAKAALLLALMNFQNSFSEIKKIILAENPALAQELKALSELMKAHPELIEMVLHLSLRTLRNGTEEERKNTIKIIRTFYSEDHKTNLTEALYLALIEDRLNLKASKKSIHLSLLEAKEHLLKMFLQPDSVPLYILQEVIGSFSKASRLSLLHHLNEIWSLHAENRTRELRAFFMILSIPVPLAAVSKATPSSAS